MPLCGAALHRCHHRPVDSSQQASSQNGNLLSMFKVRSLVLRPPRSRLPRRIRSHQHKLPWPRVSQLLPSLLLNRCRVRLQRSDLVNVLIVFLLQPFNLTLQRFHLSALLPVYDHAIASVHGMQQHSNNKNHGRRRSQTPPFQRQPRPHRSRALDPARRHRLRPRSLILGLLHCLINCRPQPFLPTWEYAPARRCSESKIHAFRYRTRPSSPRVQLLCHQIRSDRDVTSQ